MKLLTDSSLWANIHATAADLRLESALLFQIDKDELEAAADRILALATRLHQITESTVVADRIEAFG